MCQLSSQPWLDSLSASVVHLFCKATIKFGSFMEYDIFQI